MNRFAFAALSLAVALHARANGVTDWSAIAERVANDKRPPAAAEVILGLTHAAMYDAVAATGGGMRPIIATHVAPSRGDSDVAAAVAAHAVLRARVPAHAAALDGELAEWMRKRGDDAAARAGEATGREVGRVVIENRADDGFDAKLEWRAAGADAWQPTAPTPPVDVVLTRVRPIVANDLGRFGPAAPAIGSEAYQKDLAEVRRLGRKDGQARTAQQTETAMFWSDHTALQWSRALRALAAERNLDTRESARMLAMAHVAAADGLIACFGAKYRYVARRPVHAIRAAGADADPAWDSLLNVNHPEYPSGHSCFTGAITEALAAYFGTRQVPVTLTSTTTKTARRYASLDEICADVTEARILSGLHFRQSMLTGNKLGSDVAAGVVATAFTTR